MKEPIHDFKVDEIVYMMSGKKLWKGIITNNRMHDAYIDVQWLNQGGGGGSPCCWSLHRTKEDAIQEWYEYELEKLQKSHKRILNTKIK